MACFKWTIRACEFGTHDICEYDPHRNRNINAIQDIEGPGDYQRKLHSPGYEKLVNSTKKFGLSYFCVYNVSLDCPTESVVIRSTAGTTNWPIDTSMANQNNYVAFYANQSEKQPRFYGKNHTEYTEYRNMLESSSFLAIFWTEKKQNRGTFELIAECTAKEESSGDKLTQK